MAPVFGFLRPCRHHLTPELHALWSAHLCGLCTTLRDEAGQLARATTHEAGRLLGRLAHLLDAVADREDDRVGGRWNPLEATGTSSADALDRCRRAVAGIRLALRRVRHDPAQPAARELAHLLLVHETGRAVRRVDQAWGPHRGVLGGCAAAAGLCCTGQLCCADEFTGPWSGRPRQGWCGDACDAVSCSCDCCDCCGEGCDCCSCGCG